MLAGDGLVVSRGSVNFFACQVDETREGVFLDDIITILEVNDISALSHLKHVEKIPTESGTSQGKKVRAFGHTPHLQWASHI